MKIYAIIPARGGSKGIPGKNIKKFFDKPLIAHTIEEAKKVPSISRVLVSTDDSKIADISKKYGAIVPFLRPKELATDITPMIDVMLHSIDMIENEGEQIDALTLLQPTSPLRRAKHITDCINLFEKTKPDSVVSITKVPHQFSSDSLATLDGDKLLPVSPKTFQPGSGRQFKGIKFARNGPAIAILKPSVLKSGSFYGENIVGFQMDAIASIDIDTPEDFKLAELVFKHLYKMRPK